MIPRVCVIGGSTWDVLFTTTQADLIPLRGRRFQQVLAFPYGGKVDALEVVYGFGGGAANVAVGLAYLGVNVDIITRVGMDWRGREVIKNLRSFGVGVQKIQKDRRLRTALSFIVTAGRGHDHVAFVARGATVNLHIPTSLPAKYQWCYVTALSCHNWYQYLNKLFRQAHSRGQNIFWNPGASQLTSSQKIVSLLPRVTLLDLNNDEANLLLQTLGYRPEKNINRLIKKIYSLGPALVLITAGGEGAYLYDGYKVMYHPTYHVKPLNTTGAGDAFGSGWLAGYLVSGGNLKVAMQWGMLNSNSVIMHVGAQKGLLSLSTLPKFRAVYER